MQPIWYLCSAALYSELLVIASTVVQTEYMKMFLLRPSDCFRPFATNKFGGEGKMYEEQPGRWFLDHKQMLALLRRLIKHMSVIKTTKNLIDLISSSKKSIKISGWGKFSAWDMYAFFDGGSFHFKSKYRVCHRQYKRLMSLPWCRPFALWSSVLIVFGDARGQRPNAFLQQHL